MPAAEMENSDLQHQGAHVIVEVEEASSVDIQNGIEGVPAPIISYFNCEMSIMRIIISQHLTLESIKG